jgi:integrase
MGITKIKKSWWVDFSISGTRYRRRSPENTPKGAKTFEITLRQRLARGEPIDGPVVVKSKTFREYAEHWLNTYVKTNNKPSEQRAKAIVLNSHLLPYFGQKELTNIRTADVEEYKQAKLEQGLNAKTINNHLMVLSKCLRTASDWDEPCSLPKIKTLKVAPYSLDFLSEEETQKLLADQSNPTINEMIFVALRTGLRLGELRGLEWGDIDFERRILSVKRGLVRNEVTTPKNNQIRYIPLGDDVCEMLLKRKRDCGYVFLSERREPIAESSAPRLLKAVCKSAGIREAHWHLLRHTFASHLATKGVSIRIIQELLGHSTVAMTMRYAHLAPSALREAVELLSTEYRKTEFDTLICSDDGTRQVRAG